MFAGAQLACLRACVCACACVCMCVCGVGFVPLTYLSWLLCPPTLMRVGHTHSTASPSIGQGQIHTEGFSSLIDTAISERFWKTIFVLSFMIRLSTVD